jgi:GGDEF domain-containing protein
MPDFNIDKTSKNVASERETVEETITQLHRALEASLSDSIHDKETQLYSAAYFHARLQEEIVRSERYRHFLGLILIHLELRQGATATHVSHALRQVGAEMTGGLTRRTDIVALYRKRQMIIMLPETDAKGANLLVQRYEAMFPSNGRRLSYSVLTYPHDASNIESILSRLQALSEEHFRQHA